jgi:hypothetical protein
LTIAKQNLSPLGGISRCSTCLAKANLEIAISFEKRATLLSLQRFPYPPTVEFNLQAFTSKEIN